MKGYSATRRSLERGHIGLFISASSSASPLEAPPHRPSVSLRCTSLISFDSRVVIRTWRRESSGQAVAAYCPTPCLHHLDDLLQRITVERFPRAESLMNRYTTYVRGCRRPRPLMVRLGHWHSQPMRPHVGAPMEKLFPGRRSRNWDGQAKRVGACEARQACFPPLLGAHKQVETSSSLSVRRGTKRRPRCSASWAGKGFIV